jgi:AAA domain
MSVSVAELTAIQVNSKFARFIRTNLHMHTPATPADWNSQPNQTIKAEDITPELYFKELNGTSLELVAITDHNTIKWCEPLMKLAKEGRKKGTSKIHILPGVEITTYEGPHIIAVFEENMGLLGEINKLLVKFGLSGDGGPEEKVSKGSTKSITIHEVFEMITDPKLGGLIIAPHIQSEDGIWGAKGFRSRTEVLNNRKLRILSAPSGEIKRVSEGNKARLLYKNMPSHEITNSFAFLNISDCHRLNDFEVNNTWIKMSDPTLEGIRQIIYEPELRISHHLVHSTKAVNNPIVFEFSTPQEIVYPYIIGIGVSGGLLDGQQVAFSPHQNSIIGKNYSGKSALLDFLRFALDELPKKDDEAFQKLAGRLNGILTDGGEVRIYLKGKDGKTYGISRTLATSKKRGAWIIECEPDIYSLIDDEFRHDTDLSINEIFDLEIYGQGEVVKIKDNVARQMTIVDSLAKVEEKLHNLQEPGSDDKPTIFGELASNSAETIHIETQCAEWEENIAEIEGLIKEIKALEALAKSPKLKLLSSWGDLENDIHSYIERLDELKNELCNVRQNLPKIGKTRTQTKNKKTKRNTINDLSERAKTTYEATVKKISLMLDDTEIQNSLGELHIFEEDCQKQAEEIAKSLKVTLKGSPDRAHLVDRISGKKRKLASLRIKETRLTEARNILLELGIERQDLLSQRDLILVEVRKARQIIVDLINGFSADNIRADLKESANREIYRTNLEMVADNLLSASNKISNKQGQLDLIVEGIAPQELVRLIVARDIDTLMHYCGITENTAKILLGMGKRDLHLLETTLVDDMFIIKYQREGENEYVPIDSGLSGGEQALALVSVAMIPKELPLVIDQPEDELGSSLITSRLVEQIRGTKLQRQLIFVTHIANIPVLSDSEQVIYMHHTYQNGSHSAAVKHQGSLDNMDIIECLLELDGGRLAFKKRSERYSALISNE